MVALAPEQVALLLDEAQDPLAVDLLVLDAIGRGLEVQRDLELVERLLLELIDEVLEVGADGGQDVGDSLAQIHPATLVSRQREPSWAVSGR